LIINQQRIASDATNINPTSRRVIEMILFMPIPSPKIR
jgi:hypothetical protein